MDSVFKLMLLFPIFIIIVFLGCKITGTTGNEMNSAVALLESKIDHTFVTTEDTTLDNDTPTANNSQVNTKLEDGENRLKVVEDSIDEILLLNSKDQSEWSKETMNRWIELTKERDKLRSK